MELGKSAGKDGGVRDGSNGRLGVSMLEDYALTRERIELRRYTEFGAEKAHAVGSDRIQRDQDDIGLVCIGRGKRGRQNEEAKDDGAPHK